MADNFVLNSGTGGVTLAADDVTSVWYQRVKLTDGTADSSTIIASGNGTSTNALRVTVSSDSTGVLSVDDNGANLSIDFGGTAPTLNTGVVSAGTLRVTLATDVALPAGTNAIGKLSANSGVDIGDVDVTSVVPGTGATNLGKAEDAVHTTGDVGVMLLAVRNDGDTALAGTSGDYIPLGTDSSGRLRVNVTSAVTLTVGGSAASGAAIAGNPLPSGARANLNEPTAVDDGDAIYLWSDRLGRLVVVDGHPNPEAPVTVNGSAAGATVIAAPGAGVSLYVQRVLVTNRAAAENVVSLRDGAAGTIRTTINCAADGGGAILDYGQRGWKLTANTALVADIGSASADVNVLSYYIAA